MSSERVNHFHVRESQKPNMSEKIMSATSTATKCETSELSVTHTNNLTPTPFVLSPFWLGRMDDEESRSKDMEIHMDKKDNSMVDMSTTTPTSNERDSQGINIGVGDAMFPFLDMMTFDACMI